VRKQTLALYIKNEGTIQYRVGIRRTTQVCSMQYVADEHINITIARQGARTRTSHYLLIAEDSRRVQEHSLESY
jgi:hypothetical protein